MKSYFLLLLAFLFAGNTQAETSDLAISLGVAYESATQKLTSIDQQYLLNNWNDLNFDSKLQLFKQIDSLNIQALRKQQAQLVAPNLPSFEDLRPFTNYAYSGNIEDQASGLALLRQGQMGCVIVAGGQGSRLRFEGPKGLFPITPVMNKTLFQLFAEKTVAASQQAGRLLPLAIMTSPQNHQETVDFFAQHERFGLDPSQLFFYKQGILPLLDLQGNLFLETPSLIAEGPDGNGSALEKFYESGLWAEWNAKGIQYLNFIIVDNPLADPFDAELLGYLTRTKSDIVVKCTKRRHEKEKVGVLALRGAHVEVVEYSEISEAAAEARNSEGELLYGCANISLFCFRMDFIQKVMEQQHSMPLHLAFKAVKYMDASGSSQLSEKPNAWKFEKFIFDVLQFSDHVSALLYPRAECFAPLKNFNGDESPATVQAALQSNDQHILQKITGNSCELAPLEISQEFYYPTPELLKKWKGQQLSQPGYVDAKG